MQFSSKYEIIMVLSTLLFFNFQTMGTAENIIFGTAGYILGSSNNNESNKPKPKLKEKIESTDVLLERNLKNLEEKIMKRPYGFSKFKTVDKEKRASRNLKLEKLSAGDNKYRVNSFGYHTDFEVKKEKDSIKFVFNTGYSVIEFDNPEYILKLANIINFGLYYVSKSIKENSKYLDLGNPFRVEASCGFLIFVRAANPNLLYKRVQFFDTKDRETGKPISDYLNARVMTEFSHK